MKQWIACSSSSNLSNRYTSSHQETSSPQTWDSWGCLYCRIQTKGLVSKRPSLITAHPSIMASFCTVNAISELTSYVLQRPWDVCSWWEASGVSCRGSWAGEQTHLCQTTQIKVRQMSVWMCPSVCCVLDTEGVHLAQRQWVKYSSSLPQLPYSLFLSIGTMERSETWWLEGLSRYVDHNHCRSTHISTLFATTIS